MPIPNARRDIKPGYKIKGVVFDKDGTLLDFNATWMPAFRRIADIAACGDAELTSRLLAIGGYDEATQGIKSGSLFAAGNTVLIGAAWQPYLNDQPKHKTCKMIDAVFAEEGRHHARVLFDIAALFRRLRASDIIIGIASNDSVGGIKAMLEALDILHLVDFNCGYDSGYGYKPEPGMVKAFCTTTEISPADVAVVGDNPHDLEMGRRAGAGLRVGVLSGNSNTAELESFADELLASAEELPTILSL